VSSDVTDEVEGILGPYGAQLALWSRDGSIYRQGDSVPSVGMAETYAVRLDAPRETPPRYLWVQRSQITNLMAHQPIEGRSVFDARGRYLGRGGEELEDGTGAEEQVTILDMVRNTRDDVVDGGPRLTHRFHLRPGLVVHVDLPVDMTVAEARRLADFVLCLPFRRGDVS